MLSKVNCAFPSSCEKKSYVHRRKNSSSFLEEGKAALKGLFSSEFEADSGPIINFCVFSHTVISKTVFPSGPTQPLIFQELGKAGLFVGT